MLPLLAPLVGSVLSGPISSIVGGVFSSVAGQAIQTAGGVLNNAINTTGNVQNNALNQLFSFAGNLASKLFGPQQPTPRPPSSFPNPFTLPQQAFQNLSGALQNIGGAVTGMNQNFGKILDILIKQFGGPQPGQQTGTIQPFIPGQHGGVDPAFRYDRGNQVSNQGGLDGTIQNVGNKAQSLMDQAQALAASDNPADQMKAQRMMQQAQRMMEFMSNMIKIIGDMQKNAIQNMR